MNKKGFTLIELLIVVVIIGILAAIAIPKFANTKSKAYITAMKSDLRNLVSSQESFFSDSAKYTTDLTTAGLNFKASSGVASPAIVTYPGAWVATNSTPSTTPKEIGPPPRITVETSIVTPMTIISPERKCVAASCIRRAPSSARDRTG